MMTQTYLMQVTLKDGTKHYIVRPGATIIGAIRKLNTFKPCWVEVDTGAILEHEPDWVVSLSELEERLTS